MPASGRVLGVVIAGLVTIAAVRPAAADEIGRLQVAPGLVVPVLQTRDDLLVPLRWQGAGIGPTLAIESRQSAHWWRLEGELTLSGIANRFGHLGAALSAQGRFCNLWPIASVGDTRFHLGGGWGGDSLILAPLQWDDSYLYWLTGHAVAAAAAWVMPLSAADELAVTLDWPLLAIVSRPPAVREHKIDPMTQPWAYLPLAHTGLQVMGPHQYVAPHLGVAWEHRLSDRKAVRLSLRSGIRYVTVPSPVWDWQSRAAVEVLFGL